jgi:dTDP-4-dehydrorhamnose reductase
MPYTEIDATNPTSVYGSTKLEGEKAAMLNPQSIIIRTSWLYSIHGNNFVKTMMRLGNERKQLHVIFDQVGTPTHARDLASAIVSIVSQTTTGTSRFVPGTYHFSNEGVCSWYDFATEIMNLAQIDCQVNPIETKDYPTPVARPHYSVLNKSKIKSTYNLTIPYWKASLAVCIKELQ